MLLPVNDGTGVLTMRRVTPVINALFGLYHLQKIKSSKNRFYVARRSNKIPPTWKIITRRLHDVVVDNFELDLLNPYVHNPQAYFDNLILIMDNDERFSMDQLNHLVDGVHDLKVKERVELDALFNIALSLNDGHQLETLHFKSAWHSTKHKVFYFSGDGIYASKDAVLKVDVHSATQYAEALCVALRKKDINAASKQVCEYLAIKLAKVFDRDLRDVLIQQIANDLPQLAATTLSMIDNEALEP